MASSKSFRASMLPSTSSLSFSSLHHHSSSSTDSDDRSSIFRPRRRQSANIHQLHRQADAASHFSESPPDSHRSPEPVALQPLARKSKTWGDRLNSFLPSLTTSSAEPSILRKPVGGSKLMKNPPAAPAAPTAPPPPPPYDPRDPSGPPTVEMSKAVLPDSRPWLPPVPPKQSLRHDPARAPFLQTQIPDSSISDPEQPQIMPPIPPSPETRRAMLTKQKPSAQPTAPKSEPVVEPNKADAPRNGKLVKDNQGTRSRRSSILGLKEVIAPSPKMPSRESSPVADPRGRSVSTQQPAVRSSVSNSRITSSPLNARPTSHDGSQSPTRGRLRRSWLPGGRSRSNSMDVSNEIKSAAWVMSDGSQAEYNASLLKNAEKVW